MCSSSLGAPDAQFIVFVDDLHGLPRRSSKSLMHQFNTSLSRLPAGCTDELQPIDAGYGRIFKVGVGNALHKWVRNADHVELWSPKS